MILLFNIQCGRPYYKLRCPDCGEEIGGSRHTSSKGNVKIDDQRSVVHHVPKSRLWPPQGLKCKQVYTGTVVIEKKVVHAQRENIFGHFPCLVISFAWHTFSHPVVIYKWHTISYRAHLHSVQLANRGTNWKVCEGDEEIGVKSRGDTNTADCDTFKKKNYERMMFLCPDLLILPLHSPSD